MASLQEIRAKLMASNQQQSSSGFTGDNAIYPHWNIPEGSTATVRFLPDADPNNTFFWVERAMIKLPFAGIKGETNSKPVTIQVPCMEMWNETCPILTEVRPWFKSNDKALEELGRKYWKKKSYLFQGIVTDSKYQEDKTPENPIRRFIISAQIYNIVKNALMDSEIEEMPTDYVRGLDFRIAKTTKGGYADYGTSNWARRERALSAEELAAIDQYGLYDLKEFLPKKPTAAEIELIKEMFEASVDGEAFDVERWGHFYKPTGYTGNTSPAVRAAATARAQVAAPVEPVEEYAEPVNTHSQWSSNTVAESVAAAPAPAPAAPVVSDASSRAAAILSQIRNRQKQ